MKRNLLLLLVLVSGHVFSQKDSVSNMAKLHYGVSANITLYSANYGFAQTLGVSIWKRKQEVELGVMYGMFQGPYDTKNIGAELNYQYYPNGIGKRFNMFFLANSFCFYHQEDYKNNHDGYFMEKSKAVSNLYSLNLGYGFNLKIIKGFYIGPKIGLGAILENYSYIRSVSYAPDEDYYRDYSIIKFNFLAELSLGYRF